MTKDYLELLNFLPPIINIVSYITNIDSYLCLYLFVPLCISVALCCICVCTYDWVRLNALYMLAKQNNCLATYPVFVVLFIVPLYMFTNINNESLNKSLDTSSTN